MVDLMSRDPKTEIWIECGVEAIRSGNL
jgi:hypothetical protein